jgi:nucleoside 2-deoxyribosyltransferase
MKRVYICAPYAGNGIITDNVREARGYAQKAIEQGCSPFCSHVYFEALGLTEDDRDKVMEMCLEEVRRSDVVWAFEDVLTDGMLREITCAQANDIPVVRLTKDGVRYAYQPWERHEQQRSR